MPELWNSMLAVSLLVHMTKTQVVIGKSHKARWRQTAKQLNTTTFLPGDLSVCLKFIAVLF